MQNKFKSPARYLASVGIMAATLECAKLALAAIPNVEIVTLLLALYSYTFGAVGIISSFIFVCIEPIIWGFGYWFLAYLIYWPIVSLVFFLLGRGRVKNRLLLTLAAVLLTFSFGLITSFADVALSGSFENFPYRFAVLYARGALFYIIQIATNAILFLTVFKFLAKKLEWIKLHLLN